MANSENISQKFELISSTLEENNFPNIPITTAIITDIKLNNQGSLHLCSLNSCIGCGEKRQYPVALCSLIEQYGGDVLKNYEDMDTPLIDENEVSKAVLEILRKENTIPILFTHHNLTPQKTPKMAL